MSSPKIRINCTCQKDLTINNKKINRKNYNEYSSNLNEINYISRISILYEDNFNSKNDNNYITKTLEFYLHNDLVEEEFERFIIKLHEIGYISKRENPKIQYFDNDGILEYNYNFNTIKPYPKKSVKSIYRKMFLYIDNYPK